jgi:type IV pilus assembly protein PilC
VPKYKYTAVDLDGIEVSGVVDSLTRTGAGLALLERDLSATELDEHRGIMQFQLGPKRVPRKDLMHFSRQMAVFLRAGIPVLEALEVIREETTNKAFGAALADMIESLRGGSTFIGAATAHPEAFPPSYLGALGAAELTGNLDTVLDELAAYIDRDIEARRTVHSALIYPGVVFLMSIVTVVVLATFVLPRFEKFFSQLHAKLPLATRLLLSVTHLGSRYWFVLAGLGLAVVATVVLGVRTERGRNFRDRNVLKLPVLGDLVRGAILERFCRTLSSMVRAGVSLPDAIAVAADVTNNIVYRRGLASVKASMLQGEGLAGPIASTGLFPGAARQMIRVGEETGTLDKQLGASALYFERELDYKIKRFTNLFEPAVIIFMGVVVGFVAVALVSAMYGIFNQVQVK